MFTASDAADWWDKQRAETTKILEQMVDEHPNALSVLAATLVSTAMEVGAGTVDLLRLGKGAAENGLAGLGEDAMRVLNMPFIGGAVAGAAGRLAKGAMTLARRLPKQSLSVVTKCPLAAKLAAAASKAKSAIGRTLTGKCSPE